MGSAGSRMRRPAQDTTPATVPRQLACHPRILVGMIPAQLAPSRGPASRPAALLAVVALLPLTGRAARAPPSPPPAPPAAPPAAITAGVQETVLPNGLTVLVKEVRTAPVVSFSVWYRVGSRNEHTGITGVSHLLEHM